MNIRPFLERLLAPAAIVQAPYALSISTRTWEDVRPKGVAMGGRVMIEGPLLSGINNRVEQGKEDGDLAYFYALSLKLEYLTKIVTSGVVACIGDDVDRHRYSLEHKLIRADSMGG